MWFELLILVMVFVFGYLPEWERRPRFPVKQGVTYPVRPWVYPGGHLNVHPCGMSTGSGIVSAVDFAVRSSSFAIIFYYRSHDLEIFLETRRKA